MSDTTIFFGLVGIGILLFLILINRHKFRSKKGIRHYEEQRDKATIKEDPVVEIVADYASNSTSEALSSVDCGVISIIVVVAVAILMLTFAGGCVLLSGQAYNLTESDRNAYGNNISYIDDVVYNPFSMDFIPLVIIMTIIPVVMSVLLDLGEYYDSKRSEKSKKGIRHYERMRDEMTKSSKRKRSVKKK